jgi:hypothetical protein
VIRPEQPEPIEGLYDAFYAVALRGRELGSGPFDGALSTLPDGVVEYLVAMNIPVENAKGIAMGIAIGRLLP